MSAGPRKDAAKDDWCCKFCKGADGSRYRNFGSRTSCRKCNIAKGSCFGGTAKSDNAPMPSKSLAERQTDRQKQDVARSKAAKRAESKVAKLENANRNLLAANKKLLHNQTPGGKGDELRDTDVVMVPDGNVYSLEQLQELRELHVRFGSEDNPEVVELDKRIESSRKAKLAAKPGHARLAKAEYEIGRRQRALDNATAKKNSLQKQQEELQRQIVEAEEQCTATMLALDTAKVHREEVLASLQGTEGGSVGTTGGKAAASFQESSQAILAVCELHCSEAAEGLREILQKLTITMDEQLARKKAEEEQLARKKAEEEEAARRAVEAGDVGGPQQNAANASPQDQEAHRHLIEELRQAPGLDSLSEEQQKSAAAFFLGKGKGRSAPY